MTTSTDYLNQATLQIGTAGSRHIESVPCSYQTIEGKRLSIVANRRVQSATAVSVEYDNVLFVGEVKACTQAVGDAWHIEVAVDQMLTGLQSLLNLKASLLAVNAPSTARMLPAEAFASLANAR